MALRESFGASRNRLPHERVLGTMSQLARPPASQQHMWGFSAPYRCAHCKLRFVDESEHSCHHRHQHGLKPVAVENWSSVERCYGPATGSPSRASQVIDFTCLLCEQQFTSWTEVSDHLAHAHSKRVCTCCGRLFISEVALKSHLRNMHDALRVETCRAEVAATSSSASSLEASTSATNEPATKNPESGRAKDKVPTESRVLVDCSICQKSQKHPQDSDGAFSCAHCTWTSLSVSRLKSHHLEMHDKGECAQLLSQGTSGTEARPPAGVPMTRDDSVDRGSVSGRSSSVESPVQSAASNGGKIRKATVPSVDRGAVSVEKKRKKAAPAKRKLEVACPSCNFTGATLLALRLHNISEHSGEPFCESDGKCASRKPSTATKAKQARASKATSRPAVKAKQASDSSRAKKSLTAHGYQHDGFVCSDKSSLESDDDNSTITPAGSPRSDADASWYPSERSCEDTVHEEDESSGSGVDNEESGIACERCQESFASKLGLAVHMSRTHRISFFCTYCFHGAKSAEFVRLHHKREHRQLPFAYHTLDGLRLVTVGSDSDESDENSVNKERLIGRSARNPARHRHRADQKSVPRSSSQQSSANKSSSEQQDSTPWRRKRPRLLSSSSDEATDCYELETATEPTIMRSVYYGYRCPKSVRAFHQLVANISDEFKCSAFNCGFSTDNSSDFEKHLKNHDLVDVFCLYCGAGVASPRALLTHLEEDHSDLRLQCFKCLYRTAQNIHFSVHFPQAHPQDSITSVPLSSRGEPAASSPAVKSKEVNPYMCGFPGCSFMDRKRHVFERHFEEVHGDSDSYPCESCGKSCQSVIALLEHLRDHGFAEIECGYCNFGAEDAGTMMLHACYCHSNHITMFRVRNDDLGKELITSSDRGIKYEISYDLSHLTFQQRCCFCPALVSGFDDFQRHTSGKHSLTLSVQELADKLFMFYDYTEAVQHGQCPFCSFAIDDVGRLQQHVLKQELCVTSYICSACHRGFDDQLSWQKHVDNGRCSSTAALQVCENGPLLAWVQQNLGFMFKRFTCSHCTQVFQVESTFRSHLLRHYTYYPAQCKTCGQSFRGVRARDSHMRAVHGSSNSAKDMNASIEAEVKRQSISRTLHSCQKCGFQTFSQTYIETHEERCSVSESPVPTLQAYSDRSSEKATATTEEEEDVLAYYCMQCSVGFMYLERLLSHGFTHHGCDYFCSRCYRGFQTKERFLQHCRSRACRRPPSVFHVEVVKRSSKRKFFYREIAIDYDGPYTSSGEDDELEESYYSFYNEDYEPVQGIGCTYITDEKTGMKVPVSKIPRIQNIEPYVCVLDWKKTLF
ncbi:hypothetical protein HPB50_017974 [Hyalomma asiaticum]|uniref:Uncharacterized protein n=1 Tax=Hyalomma asiaticum TaxID=266040 RepID=A0ACB7TAT7_HYAAI|nr:hypothetical protein HPB50_017974 [Hyalomma asiaticum]